MTTIDRDLLVAKGTIDALRYLAFHVESATTHEVALEMDLSESTARTRLSELIDAGLVTELAELRDDTPTRVYRITDDGSDVATTVTELLPDDAAE